MQKKFEKLTCCSPRRWIHLLRKRQTQKTESSKQNQHTEKRKQIQKQKRKNSSLKQWNSINHKKVRHIMCIASDTWNFAGAQHTTTRKCMPLRSFHRQMMNCMVHLYRIFMQGFGYEVRSRTAKYYYWQTKKLQVPRRLWVYTVEIAEFPLLHKKMLQGINQCA